MDCHSNYKDLSIRTEKAIKAILNDFYKSSDIDTSGTFNLRLKHIKNALNRECKRYNLDKKRIMTILGVKEYKYNMK